MRDWLKGCTEEFWDIEVIHHQYRVVWEYIGEGMSGDFDETDLDDYPHLRFSCFVREGGEWKELEDGSYCTALPTSTPRWALLRVADRILDVLGSPAQKARLEDMSWVSINDFEELHREEPPDR